MRAHVHTARLVVRWGDMDALRHVNNAAYFTYFEQARVEALAALGVALGADAAFVIASTAIVYRRPVTYPATVLVHVSAGPPGGSSFPTFYELTVEGDPAVCATAEATLVQVDAATGRPTRLSDPVRQALEQRLSGPPAAAR
jgi:acyl-CoA thioester hydrolase